MITIEELIQEAYQLRSQIKEQYVPEDIIITFIPYQFDDNSRYERWKHTTVRFLSNQYPGDRCITDFEKAIETFENQYYSPQCFDTVIGLLESCKSVPEIPKAPQRTAIDKSINVNVSQSQSQTQNQALNVLLEAIKDEITGRQLKEIKEIISTEAEPQKAKEKIINKIKTWGQGVTASIIANIITNPSIWQNL